jgi:hypothetical protein
MTMVDKYTWVLTNLCSWVSTISQTQFNKVEKVLISVLLDSSSSTLNSTMVADIWCFLARPGMAHLTLLLRVVDCRQDKKVLAEVRRSVGTQGEGRVGVLASMAMGEMPGDLGDEMDRWRVGRSTGRR